jgi:Flp pilus assembly protein TadD
LLAQLQSEAGYPELAVSLATSAVSNSGGAPEMRLALVRLLFAKGDLARASAELASLKKILPSAAPVLTATGELHLLKREFPAARTAFEAALQKDPASLDALTGLIAVDVVSGRADAARTRVEAELSKTPNRTGVQLLAAKVYGALRDFPKAETMMKTAIAGNPSSMEAYGMLGQFLYQQGRLEEGRQEFLKLTQQQPRNVSALTMLAIIVNRLGNREEAMRRYDEILAIDSEAAVAANNLAWMLVERDRELDRAVQLATIAAHRLPAEAGVADTLGWAYVKRGMASFGLPHLITVVQKHPQDPAFRYHLGAAYVQMKEPLKARAELEQALKLSSSFPGADDARRLLDSLR